MTKVLNILTDSNIGGAGRYLVNYLKNCDRNRFSVTVVLPRGSLLIPQILATDTPVIEAEHIADRSFSLAAISILLKIIRSEKPDIVHTHGSLSGRIAGKLAGCRVIFTRHCAFPVPEYLKKGPGHWINGTVNRLLADQIIAVSPASEANLVEVGVPKDKINTMMNGVDPTPSISETRKAELRQQLHIPEGIFTAGILARLESYKGHMLLLEAAQALAAEGRDFRILIGGSGPSQQEILDAISKLGLEKHVLFLGFVENVADILGILDVQINCSYGTETSSLSLIEGMSAQLATVASDYGGNPWLIDDGVTGLLFRSGDSADLKDKLSYLMDNPETLSAMQKNARIAYEARFTGAIFAKNVEAVYEKVMRQT